MRTEKDARKTQGLNHPQDIFGETANIQQLARGSYPKVRERKKPGDFDTHPNVKYSDKRARSQETTSEASKKAKPNFSLSKPDFSLDPANPPKYCPECAWEGTKSRVKKMKSDDNSRIIMCKNEDCPWPFSVATLEEATIFKPKPKKTYLPVVLERREQERENDLTSILRIDTNWSEFVEDELHSDREEEESLLAPIMDKTSWDQLVLNNFTQEEIGNDAESLFHQLALFNDNLTENAERDIEIVDLEADDLVNCAFVDLVGDENNSYSPSGETSPDKEENSVEPKEQTLVKQKTPKQRKQRKCLKTKGRKKQDRKFSSFKGFSEVGSKFVKIKHQVKRAKSRKQVRFADRGERA